jgi:hypothetical protein
MLGLSRIVADFDKYGKLSDTFGRRFMLQFSYGLFAAGSLLWYS